MAATVTGPVRIALLKASDDFLLVARVRALDELARAVVAGDAGMARRLSDLVIEIEQRLSRRAPDEDTLTRRLDVACRAGLPAGTRYPH